MTAEARDLDFRYPDGSPALRQITLEVRAGEVLGLLGPNGSGKTTLLRLLADGERPGLQLDDPARGPRGRWLATERPAFRAWLSGRGNAEALLELRGIPRAEAAVRADRWLTELGLDEDAERPVGAYSTGMTRRLGLAIAFAAEPALLLLDEPLAGLDPAGQATLARILAERREHGGATALATHDPEFAAAHCDRVGFLLDGATRALDTPAALLGEVGGSSRIEVRFVAGAPPGAPGPPPASVSTVERDAEGAIVETRDAGAALPEVIAWLLEGGARIAAVEVREPSLRDAFFRITGARLEADGS